MTKQTRSALQGELVRATHREKISLTYTIFLKISGEFEEMKITISLVFFYEDPAFFLRRASFMSSLRVLLVSLAIELISPNTILASCFPKK